jgi:protein-S-isoprenylcysteine O-methyltransferase Ste14
VAGIVAAGGVVLVLGPALALHRHGVPLVRVTPGPVLVTDGWYGRVRHPQHVGMLLLVLAPPIAMDDIWLWVVAVGAGAWLVAGREPLEERHLLEEFEDDFLEYRAAVPRWVPKVGD